MIEKKLSTREFARMCGVERRTLHYYDEIDLLKPIEVEPNGYRVYASHQIDTMGMIKALQAVGMPLNEIKRLMNEENLTVSMPLLQKQIQLIKEKQEELRNAEHMLTHATNQLNDYLIRGEHIFYKEYKEKVPVIIKRLTKSSMPFINYVTYGYQYGVIMKEGEPSVLEYVYRMAVDNEGNAVIPGGNYACIYKRAQNGKAGEIISSFFKELEARGINTTGSLYMDNIATDFIKLPNDEYLFKLSIKCSE